MEYYGQIALYVLGTAAGVWIQTFSTSRIGELWTHHESTLKHLAEVTGSRPIDHETSLTDDFVRAVREQAEYIRSLPLWPLRIPYWYFVRRNLRHNKSVRQLMGDNAKVTF